MASNPMFTDDGPLIGCARSSLLLALNPLIRVVFEYLKFSDALEVKTFIQVGSISATFNLFKLKTSETSGKLNV